MSRRSALPGLAPSPKKRSPVLSHCLELVHVDTTRCPTCGTPTTTSGWAQPALFYFGGYGATTLKVTRRCGGCGWRLTDEQSISPRRGP